MRSLVTDLDQIDTPEAYQYHRWFHRSRPSPENAQVLYLTGDMAIAWTEIQAMAKAMADRKNANSPDWWI